MAKRQVVLVILDGWGVGPRTEANAIYAQGTPNLDYLKENFLIGALQTSGMSVGLPEGIAGNAEGHQTLSAGRIIYQHYPRIAVSIRDNSFAKNPVLLESFEQVKKNNSALNLVGLLTEGTIHASFYHLISLIKLAKQNKVPKINLHLFTDGKDSNPKSALKLIGGLLFEAGTDGIAKIASLSGRYFALDREKHWDRTQKTYQALTGEAPKESDVEKLIQSFYSQGLDDYYFEPRVIDPERTIKSGDAVFFFNFREDSIRQIAMPFILPDFQEFPVKKLENLYVATMTHYSDQFNAPVAFPPEKIENPIGRVLADNGKTQLRIAETEKYAHITYFFNGFRQEPFKNEFRILVPSLGLLNYAEKPEMQSREVTTRTLQAINDEAFDFILVNYPNGDMVAHSGNFEATKKAVEVIDEEISKLAKAALNKNVSLIITSDHGNIELMRDLETGEITTSHDTSPVPIYIVGKEFIKKKTSEETLAQEKNIAGTQADVTATILEILNIPKPPEMTGESLLKKLG